MGILIHFPERLARSAGVSQLSPLPESARILFFTGVRYMRDTTESPVPNDGSANDAPRSRRRRG